MRALLASLTALGVLVGCGGGGAGGAATGSPQVNGKVTRRTGSEAGLAGVTVTCGNTGESDVTGADGSFSFEVPSGEDITVSVEDGAIAVTGGGWDCEEGEDGTPDGVDADEDEVVVGILEDGEVVTIEIEIEDGEIIECWVGRGEDGYGGGEGECPLIPDPVLAPEGRGELEVARDGDCLDLEVEVAGVAGPQTLDLVLLTPWGEHALGQLEVGEDGTGHFEGRVCAPDLPDPPPEPLPLPLPLPPDLPPGIEGSGEDSVPLPTFPEIDPFAVGILLLVDAEGNALFVGFLPGPGIETGDGWSEPGEGWEGGGEGGGLPGIDDLPELGDVFNLPPLPPELGASLENLLAPFLPR